VARTRAIRTRRYQVAAKRWNATRAPLPWRRVSRLNWVGGRGEAKHKSKPNCKTNTWSWVKCRVRRDIDTHSSEISLLSPSFFLSHFIIAMSYRNYVFCYWYGAREARCVYPGFSRTLWNSLTQTSSLRNFADFMRGFRCYVGNWCIRYIMSSSHDSSCFSKLVIHARHRYLIRTK